MSADRRGRRTQDFSGRLIKICGLNSHESVAAAVEAGADMLGLVFFPKSPRHLGFREAAELVAQARRGAADVGIVALTVDASDDELAAIVESIEPDWLQLHGKETPERVAMLRGRFGASHTETPDRPDAAHAGAPRGLNLPGSRIRVMKAIGIAGESDVALAQRFAPTADMLLLDAKPAAGMALPGGNGVVFDHRLIAGREFGIPFMLSGGLDASNVAAAVRLVRPQGVDVSSGVESAPGVKDAARIGAFVRAAREALDMNG